MVICPLSLLKYNNLGATLNLFPYLATHIQVLCYLHTKQNLTINISYLYLCHSVYTANEFLLHGQHNINLFHGNQFLHRLARVFFEQWNSFSTSISLQAHLGPSPSSPYLTPFLWWVNLVWPFPGIVSFLLILEWEALLVTGIFTLCRCVLKYNFPRDHFSGHLIKKNQFYPHDLLFSFFFLYWLFPKYSEIWTHVTHTYLVHTCIYCYIGE